MSTTWRPVRFGFDDSPTWDGWTDDTRWNGFLNVEVEPVVHAQMLEWFQQNAEDGYPGEPECIDECMADVLAMTPNGRGRYSYANGYATQEVE